MESLIGIALIIYGIHIGINGVPATGIGKTIFMVISFLLTIAMIGFVLQAIPKIKVFIEKATIESYELYKESTTLISRIKAVENQCNEDKTIMSFANQLLQVAQRYKKAIKNTPDTKEKRPIVKKQLDKLEFGITKLEKLNLYFQMGDKKIVEGIINDLSTYIKTIDNN